MIVSGRTSLLLFCLLAALTSVAAAKGPDDLGRMADKNQRGVVKQSLPCQQQLGELNRGDIVKVRMCVEAEKRTWARFDIGRRGDMRMGPESRFEFREGRFDPDTGELKVGLEIMWGIFRFIFDPPSEGEETGEVKFTIKGDDRWIHLYGTDVFLRVEKNGTTVLYVAEGEVAIDGLEPRVKTGEWTTFGPGLPPQPPMPAGRDAAGRTQRRGEPEIPGPALLDITSGRLDLPKSRLP